MRVESPRSSRAKSRGAGITSQTPLDYARDERSGITVNQALRAATEHLALTSDTPRLDAELLMAHALVTERDVMLLSALDQPVPPGFDALISRRERHEPVAYIIGRRAFWTIDLEVGPGVLIPRPDSETLIEAAAAHFGRDGPRTLLDLGTGPGTLLLAALAEWPGATGIGIDASEVALGFARRNAARLGIAERADFRIGDWGTGIGDRFDLILCNPPYVETGAALPRDVSEWEPAEALFAGEDGLAAYRELAPQLARLLAPGGIACLEIGAGQEPAVRALFAAAPFTVSSRMDLKGHPRCLILGV